MYPAVVVGVGTAVGRGTGSNVALAAFAAASQTTDAFFFGAFMAMGLYLATLAAAILAGGVYAR
ncbi:MAG TPA: hypothetical protein VG276_11130 [Actinomycetes bacterium]|nr:hypothetical protein [Actinomycetes bacterium]